MSRETSDGSFHEDGRRTDAGTGSAGTTATIDDLRARIAAVERACTDGADADLTDLADAAEATADLHRASTRLDDLEARVAELESATQALRGYVGSIRAVNERVERRADRALAATRGEPAEERPDRLELDHVRPPVSESSTDGPTNAAGEVGDGQSARSSGRDRSVGADPRRGDSDPSRGDFDGGTTEWARDPADRTTDPTGRAGDPTGRTGGSAAGAYEQGDDDASLAERLRDAL